MANKTSRNQKKTNKRENWALLLSVALGFLTLGVVVGVLGSGLLHGGKIVPTSGKKVQSGELIDYQERGMLTLGDYRGLPMSLEATEEDVENEKEYLLETYPKPLDGPAKEGDVVNIDFAGTLNGVAFDGGTSEDEMLEIGANEYIPGFEEQIVGMKAGDKKDITVTFPEDYGDETLDGKEVVFAITFNYVAGTDEFNDAFVRRISEGEYNTVAEYEDYMREYLVEENEESKAENYWSMVLDAAEIEEVDEGEYDKAYEEILSNYTNFEEVSGQSMEEAAFGDDVDVAASDLAIERMVARTIAKIENAEMTDAFYKDALIRAIMDEEEDELAYQDKTIEELEKEYWDMSATDPKDDMLLEWVKEYVAKTAELV